MRHWRLPEVETPQGARSPVVLHSREGAERAVLIELRAGEALGDHGVKESALLLVLDGAVRVEAGDEAIAGDAGSLFHFDPDERRSVTSDGGARLLKQAVQVGLTVPFVGPDGIYDGSAATTFTIASDRFAGDSADGLLAFQPPEPTACTTPTGATTAAISGLVGLGSL